MRFELAEYREGTTMSRYVQKPLKISLSRPDKKAAARDLWIRQQLEDSRTADEKKRARLRALRIANTPGESP